MYILVQLTIYSYLTLMDVFVKKKQSLRCRFSTVICILIDFRFLHQSLWYFKLKIKKYIIYLTSTNIIGKYFKLFYLILFDSVSVFMGFLF